MLYKDHDGLQRVIRTFLGIGPSFHIYEHQFYSHRTKLYQNYSFFDEKKLSCLSPAIWVKRNSSNLVEYYISNIFWVEINYYSSSHAISNNLEKWFRQLSIQFHLRNSTYLNLSHTIIFLLQYLVIQKVDSMNFIGKCFAAKEEF